MNSVFRRAKTISCVDDKIRGAFVCVTRPLADGEQPKHPHDKSGTVYEATDAVNPNLSLAILSGKQISVSVKIDGTCCMIENGVYYRRRDIRHGAKIPDGAILGMVDENGQANIAWLKVTDSKDPEDRYHLSAIDPDDQTSFGRWIKTVDRSSFHLLSLRSERRLS